MRGCRGFTLVESVIALTVLTLVAGACLQLRAQSLVQTRAIAGRQSVAREARILLRLAEAGYLDVNDRERVDQETQPGVSVWTGTRGGRSYRIVREPMVVSNPVRAAVGEDLAGRYPETIQTYRYTLTLGGDGFTLESVR